MSTNKATLTKQDIETLIDALDVWEDKDSAGEMMTTIMGTIIPQAARAQYEIEVKKVNERKRIEQRMRKERSIMLKARLLQMRDQIEAGEFIADLP